MKRYYGVALLITILVLISSCSKEKTIAVRYFLDNEGCELFREELFESDEEVRFPSASDIEKEGFKLVSWETFSRGVLRADENSGFFSGANQYIKSKILAREQVGVFPPGTTTKLNYSIDVYPVWEPAKYSLTFVSENVTGYPVHTTIENEFSSKIFNQFNPYEISRVGYSFRGWNESPTGDGDYYFLDSIMNSHDLELYAQWTTLRYVMTYHLDNTNGRKAYPEEHFYGESVIVKNPFDPSMLIRDEWQFTGWNTQADGSGTLFPIDSTIVQLAMDVDLYAQWKPVTYQTVFYGNGNDRGAAPQPLVLLKGASAILPELPQGCVRDEYLFQGWNSKADGSGDSYLSGNEFEESGESRELYAQWKPITYQTLFHGNGINSGNPPRSLSLKKGESTIFPALSDEFSRDEYRFLCWNSMKDGSGTEYLAGSNFTETGEDRELYAQWERISYKTVFNGNGNDSGVLPQAFSLYKGDQMVISSPEEELGLEHYIFRGWNTETDGTGIAFEFGASLTEDGTGRTLYAQWEPELFNLTLLGSGNDSGEESVQLEVPYKDVIELRKFSSVLNKRGYSFDGWKLNAESNKISFKEADLLTMPGEDTTLYANWMADEHNITFVGNGKFQGDPPPARDLPFGSELILPGTSENFHKKRYLLSAWNTAPNGSGESYKAGDNLVIDVEDITLYAQWERDKKVLTTKGIISMRDGSPGIPMDWIYSALAVLLFICLVSLVWKIINLQREKTVYEQAAALTE